MSSYFPIHSAALYRNRPFSFWLPLINSSQIRLGWPLGLRRKPAELRESLPVRQTVRLTVV